jgi:hypothetical protein
MAEATKGQRSMRIVPLAKQHGGAEFHSLLTKRKELRQSGNNDQQKPASIGHTCEHGDI